MSDVLLTHEEMDFLFSIIRRAGDFALSHWPSGEEQRPFTVEAKEDESLVTSVDIAVNEMLVSELSRRFPSCGIYSEELAPSENMEEASRVWVLDPIDGTWNFVHGDKEFGVLLGLVENHEIVFGIAYFPALEMFFWAGKGLGAFCNDHPLNVSSEKQLLPRSIYVRHGGVAAEEYIFPHEFGTAQGFYFLCTGKVDALVVRITQHKEWDYCPFLIIVEESGATITDEKGERISCYFEIPKVKFIVAANTHIHEEVLGLLPPDGVRNILR